MTSASVSRPGISASSARTGTRNSVPSAWGTRNASACAPSTSLMPKKPPCKHEVCSPSWQKMHVPSVGLTHRAREVLFVGHVFHPANHLAVECFLDGDVGHRGAGCRTMPVPVVRRAPDDISGPDFLFRAALALRPSAAGDDDQRL